MLDNQKRGALLPEMSDDNDDELKRAIAMSLSESNTTKVEDAAAPVVKSISGLAGFDRAAMERDRLARLQVRQGTTGDDSQSGRKRRRDISPPPISRPSKVARVTPPEDIPSSSVPSRTQSIHNAGSTALQHPHGKLFKTWAFKQARNGNEIKIEEVFEKNTLEMALLSSFQYDLAWLFTKFNTQKTRFHFVVHENKMPQGMVKSGPTGAKPAQTEKRPSLVDELQSLGPNVKAYAPTEGRCMHSKLMLLVHRSKLRVVVPSANLVPYDWGEDGIMENTVWLIDLPRRDLVADIDDFQSTPFLDELKFFLGKQRLPLSVLTGLNKFDWSATKPYAFVHTVAGHSYRADMARTGLTGLSSAVRQLGLTSTKTEVDMCASSVGALSSAQVLNLHAAAQGDYHVQLPESGRATVLPQGSDKEPLSSKFRLYFPTYDYIAGSPGGVGSGGTIWFSKEYYNRQEFPSYIFREFKSTRPHLLSHCKMLFVRGISAPPVIPTTFTSSASSFFDKDKEEGQKPKDPGPPAEQVAYIYAGSANCSKSAWGNVSIDRAASSAYRGEAKIFCENWECGVLIPVLGPGVKEKYNTAKYGAGFRLTDNDQGDGNKATGEQRAAGVPSSAAGKIKSVGDDDETESEDEGTDAAVAATTATKIKLPAWDVFKFIIDGPFQYPAEKFGSKEPWYVKEHHPAYKRGGGRPTSAGEE
ncbi:tyrosyl-DNA phosphodiesterase-domain-containing protein [Elsinoe ampelina]|uniref:Tyrosyl-DNA phosphodiesterase-domain-containing protein n=1 Tax=Elsinoe ampelina TaxID=302913 RepID=A0A6A6GAG0_9PEZI|nr:tyrosyl-DNA phosphodiesterase-domain-containing protein [Elsinoe ampelina]